MSDREILIRRRIDVPRQRAWSAWTEGRQLAQWWAPLGFSISTREIDIHPGGVWRFVMQGPDGVDYDNRVLYLEVLAPERMVYRLGSDDADDPGLQVSVTFDEQEGATLVTMRSLYASAEARDYVVREFGAIESGEQTLDRLEELLTRL